MTVKGSDNDFPSILVTEQSSKPTAPSTGKRRLYMKTDHLLYSEDSSGAETPVSSNAFIGARYTTNAGQSISGTPIINFEDQTYDTGSLVTVGASWKFTAPVTGYYRVTVLVMFDATSWTEGKSATLYLHKNNGSALSLIGQVVAVTGTETYALGGSDTIYLTASEYIDVRLYQDQGTIALFNDGVYNHISIERVG